MILGRWAPAPNSEAGNRAQANTMSRVDRNEWNDMRKSYVFDFGIRWQSPGGSSRDFQIAGARGHPSEGYAFNGDLEVTAATDGSNLGFDEEHLAAFDPAFA